MKTYSLYLACLATLCLLFIKPHPASAALQERKIPSYLNKDLTHLQTFINPHNAASFSVDSLQKLLEFVASQKPGASLFYAADYINAPSAYYEFTLNIGLDRILAYAFNPNIPSYIFMPSSVRLTYQLSSDQSRTDLKRLLTESKSLDKPIIMHGIEHTENTPDITTESYYGYDNKKTVILCKHDGKRVLISLTRQKDKSNVGKKGMVIGADNEWTYLYSGKKGMSKPGLGWVSAYMYDSAGVSIYYETEPGKPFVKCGMFKWLRAGWSNINVVKKTHIHNGLKRYADGFKSIMESPTLPPPNEIGSVFSLFKNMSASDLKVHMQHYVALFKNRLTQKYRSRNTKVSKLIDDGDYFTSMPRKESEALLMKEYLKSSLGKSPDVDTTELTRRAGEQNRKITDKQSVVGRR